MSTTKCEIALAACGLLGLQACVPVVPEPSRDAVYRACFPWTGSDPATDALIVSVDEDRRNGFTRGQEIDVVQDACEDSCAGFAQPCDRDCLTCGIAVIDFVY